MEFPGYPTPEGFSLPPEAPAVGGEKDKYDEKKKKSEKKSSANAREVTLPTKAKENAWQIGRALGVGGKESPKEPLWGRKESAEQSAEMTLFQQKRSEYQDQAEGEAVEIESGVEESAIGPLESLDIATVYVDTRQADLQAEAANPNATEAEREATDANAAFIEAVSQQLARIPEQTEQTEGETPSVEDAVEAAFDEVVEDYGLAEQAAATSETSPAEDADEEQPVAASTNAAAAVGASPFAGGVAGGPPSTGYAAPATGMGSTIGRSANMYAAPPVETAPVRATREAADGFVPFAVGATLGYFIGKRRGRRQAEQRLTPQVQKLETEVKQQIAVITNKEAKIRHLVRMQNESLRTPAKPAPVAEAARAAEAPRTPDAPAAATRLAEASPFARTEQTPTSSAAPRSERAPQVTPGKQESKPAVSVPAETMSKQELLEAGAAITIGNESLRSIFEGQHAISEEGLRRIVAEYQRGHDIGHALKDEMLKHELHFERLDDKLQQSADEARSAVQEAHQGGFGGAMGMDMSNPHATAQTVANAQSAAAGHLRPQDKVQAQTHQTLRPVLVAANVVAFVVLAILVIVLLTIYL